MDKKVTIDKNEYKEMRVNNILFDVWLHFLMFILISKILYGYKLFAKKKSGTSFEKGEVWKYLLRNNSLFH
jgi:hypothetical protein